MGTKKTEQNEWNPSDFWDSTGQDHKFIVMNIGVSFFKKKRGNGFEGNPEIIKTATPNTNPEGKADSSLISEWITTLVSAGQAVSVKSYSSTAAMETHVVRATRKGHKEYFVLPPQTDIVCMCLAMYM